jgi:hypothetical protein
MSISTPKKRMSSTKTGAHVQPIAGDSRFWFRTSEIANPTGVNCGQNLNKAGDTWDGF